ncbi:CocE/NonD family hydrolase [Streptomyces caniscabiei]|uniref:CocE/NonD family hydrolase n=1 Tax=Streptomyces caniscabiei TaxID=2746961 RepID=UPI000765BF01|nr:CocE/NonD family hydrolase [Streptomyces caniscabiei]
MNVKSHVVQRLLKLPPPPGRGVTAHRDLRVPMPDGVDLLADRWVPRTGGEGLPTLLIRTPYGRGGVFGGVVGRAFAEHGYQVLIQSTRGGFGSGGTFDPMRQERVDGLATLDWVIKQPWFGDAVVLWGPSYMGHVQWAVADQLPPQVKAMITNITESALTMEFLRADGMSLETPFGWGVLVGTQERPLALLRKPMLDRKTERALRTLPLGQADMAAFGERSQYIQDILAHDADDPRWTGFDHSHRVADVSVPVSSIGGWYDIFLPGQLRDFRILQDAERPARLTVGPWTHRSTTEVPFLEALEFGLAHARGEQPPQRPPVRLYVMGEESWRDFESWPPRGYEPQRFHLQPGGAMASEIPGRSEPDRYRYDPADPTPAVGGVRMDSKDRGRVDNTELEARPDVLTYSTPPLEEDVEVIGEVSAEIWFTSSLSHADVFVRLCDVDTAGRSWNVCDGLVGLNDADGAAQCATVSLWPTAYRFRRGHRIRVQVSSGAFPRFARNPGTGESRATATVLMAAEQSVHHDPEHPSAIILPTRTGD